VLLSLPQLGSTAEHGNVSGSSVDDNADGRRADLSNLTRWDLELHNKVHAWFSDRTAASSQYGSIGEWDTSNVTSMQHLFDNTFVHGAE
jgi:hypothetical protein